MITTERKRAIKEKCQVTHQGNSRFWIQGSRLLNFSESRHWTQGRQLWRWGCTRGDGGCELEQGAVRVCVCMCVCVLEAVFSQLECDWLTLIRSAAGAPIVIQSWPPASPTVISTGTLLLRGLHSGANTQRTHGHPLHTHTRKTLRKHTILVSWHTLNSKCVCWQTKKPVNLFGSVDIV